MVTCLDSGWTYLSGARSVTVYVPAWRLSTRMVPSGSGHHVFFDSIPGNMKRNTGNLAIFGGFHKLQGTRLDLKGKIAFYGFSGAFDVKSDYILVFITQPVFGAACYNTGDRGRQFLFCGDCTEFLFNCRKLLHFRQREKRVVNAKKRSSQPEKSGENSASLCRYL